MNDAKTVLFAISTETISAEKAKKFEDDTMKIIRSGNRDYYNSNSVHCDYKDGLIKMCQQYRPSVAIVNELLPGMGNVFDIVKEIKSEFPEIIIVMLLKDARVVGDAVLANLTAAGIYNWLSAPWRTEAVASLVVTPKKMKDVEAYIPKIVEGSNGLAFETKIVERVEDELDDIVAPNFSSSSNALAMDGKLDDFSLQKENLEVGYHKVIGKGFTSGFGSKFKIGAANNMPILNPGVREEAEPEVKPEIKEEVKPVVKEEIKPVEDAPKAPPQVFSKTIKEEEKVKEEPKQEVQKQEVPVPPKPVANKRPKKELRVEQRAILDRIRVKDAPEEKQAVKQIPEEEAKKSIQAAVAQKPVEKKVAKLLSLSEYNFVPKYNKVLFIRALPLSTVFPIHIADLSSALFVDFNKESCYDGFANVYKTTIKECQLPNNGRIVADAVAGNGIEKVAKKFDYVIAIVPEDDFVINTFVKRYPDIADLVLVQNSNKVINFKERGNIFGDKVKTISFLNEKTPIVQESLTEKKLLLDSPEYAKDVNFIVQSLNKENNK